MLCPEWQLPGNRGSAYSALHSECTEGVSKMKLSPLIVQLQKIKLLLPEDTSPLL
jgi:hypothetical protein